LITVLVLQPLNRNMQENSPNCSRMNAEEEKNCTPCGLNRFYKSFVSRFVPSFVLILLRCR